MTNYEMAEISNNGKAIRIIDIDFNTKIIKFETASCPETGEHTVSIKDFIDSYLDEFSGFYYYVTNPEAILSKYKNLHKLYQISKEDIEKMITKHLIIEDIKEIDGRLFVVCEGDKQFLLSVFLENFEKNRDCWTTYIKNFEKLKQYITEDIQ